MVEERERGGGWRSLGDLAGRSGAFAETLGRLAWAGACDELLDGSEESRRRRALWELGVAVPGNSVPEGTQLALPLEPHEGPELRALSAWERMLADYGSTGVTLREHPLELMRPSLPGDLRTSEELERHPDGRRVRVAGLVVARQRPATAKGVTFMLLEDEHGTINLDHPSACVRALPPGGAVRAAAAGHRPPRAPRGHDERGGGPDRAPGAPRPAARGDQAHRAAPVLEHRDPGGGDLRAWCRRPRRRGLGAGRALRPQLRRGAR